MISFFRYLRIVEDCVMNGCEYSVFTKNTIQRLIGYVETGGFCSGSNTAWIAKRWRLSVNELKEEWKRETGVDKSEQTFRCQIHTLSKTLYSLFPEEDFGAFFSEENDNIYQTLNALEFDEKPFCTIYPEEVCRYVGVAEQTYTMKDLKYEISVLKAIIAVKCKFSELDTDKLSYIRNIIDSKVIDCPLKPLMLRELGLCL